MRGSDVFKESYRFSGNAAYRVLDSERGEEAVIVHPTLSRVLSLNHTGTVIWKALEEGDRTFEQLVSALEKTLLTPAETLREDTRGFLDTLLERGLIERVEPAE